MAWCALDTLNLPILRPRKDGKAEKKKNKISARLTPSKSDGSLPTGGLINIETYAVKFVVVPQCPDKSFLDLGVFRSRDEFST